MRLPLLICVTALAGCAAPSGLRPDAGSGSISGRIAYPSEVVPAMRICAVPAAGTASCSNHPAGETHYRLDRLAAGEYQVLVSLSEGDMRVGGHVHQVQCIRAPCPEQPKTVVVAPGADLTGIDINGFYTQREDFPAPP